MVITKSFGSLKFWQQLLLVTGISVTICVLVAESMGIKTVPWRIGSEGFASQPIDDSLLVNTPSLTLYYATWCPMSNDVLLEWEKVTQFYLGTNMKISAVDCDAYPEVMKAANVSSFPTIVFTKNGIATEYRGVRTAAAIARFVELS